MSNEAYAASFAQEVADEQANTPEAIAARKAAAEAYVKQLEAEEAYRQLIREQYRADPLRSDRFGSGGRSRRRSRKTKHSRRSRK